MLGLPKALNHSQQQWKESSHVDSDYTINRIRIEAGIGYCLDRKLRFKEANSIGEVFDSGHERYSLVSSECEQKVDFNKGSKQYFLQNGVKIVSPLWIEDASAGKKHVSEVKTPNHKGSIFDRIKPIIITFADNNSH